MSPKHLLPKAQRFAADATKEMDDFVKDLQLVADLQAKAVEARRAASDVRASDATRLARAAFAGEKTAKPTATSPLDDAADLAERVAEEAALMPEVREQERRARVHADMAELALSITAHVEAHRAEAEAEVRRAIRRYEALVGSLASETVIRDASRKAPAPFAMGIRNHLVLAEEKPHVRYLTAAMRQAAEDLGHVCAEMAREEDTCR